MKKKTLVLGASLNSDRYSNMAVKRLTQHGHSVIAVGNRPGKINEVEILQSIPREESIDTVTLYLNPANQVPYYEQIINLHPKRIIFNPGTENAELEQLAEQHGIDSMEACTLVMLGTNQY